MDAAGSESPRHRDAEEDCREAAPGRGRRPGGVAIPDWERRATTQGRVTLRLASLAHGKLVRLAALDDGTPLRVGALVLHAHRAPAFLVVAALALIYIPDIGHGFLRDDFMWLRVAQVEAPSDVGR